jgi:hypothetical protein
MWYHILVFLAYCLVNIQEKPRFLTETKFTLHEGHKKEFFMKNMEKSFGTQKQWFCVVILALVCAGTAFAQQSRTPAQPAPANPARPAAGAAASAANKDALSLDLNYLLRGFIESDTESDTLYVGLAPAYEHLVASHVSIGGEAHIVFGTMFDSDILYLGAGFNTRIYLAADRMDGWFFGATVGFNLLAVEDEDGDLKCDPDDGFGFLSLYTTARLGYKYYLADTFFLEPSLAYTHNGAGLSLGGLGGLFDFASGGVMGSAGWTAGIRLGFSFK